MVTQIPQGTTKTIRFELRRGDGTLADPDGFNSAVQSTWPVTTIRNPALATVAWKPSGSGDDPNLTGLRRYGAGQYGQDVAVPAGSATGIGYTVLVSGAPPNGLGGAVYSGSGEFEVVIAGSVISPPTGLIDRAYALKIIGPKEPASYGYSAQADLDVLVDEAILAASGIVRRFCERNFVEETTTATLDVLDSDDIALKLPSPLKSITGVTEAGKLLSSSEYSFRRNGFLLRHDANGQPKAWTYGVGRVVVQYTEGEADVPAEVKWATARVVEALLSNIVVKRKTPFVQVGEFEMQVPNVYMLPRDILDALKPHRRLAAGAV